MSAHVRSSVNIYVYFQFYFLSLIPLNLKEVVHQLKMWIKDFLHYLFLSSYTESVNSDRYLRWVYKAKFGIRHKKTTNKTLTGFIYKKQDSGMLKHMPLHKYSK